MEMANSNVLEGVKCPKCGQDDSFVIRATALFVVTDNGILDVEYPEWDEDSITKCKDCGFTGRLEEFDGN